MTNDADGRMLSAARSNGVDTAYGYDVAGRLNNIAHTNGATVIDEFTYSLDGNGNRTAVTSTAGSESYTLDGLNRVTDVSYPGGVSEAFTYDPAGNRVEHTNTDGDTIGFTVDDTGQLISDTTGTTYSYDQAGNLLATSAGDAYVYDDYGRTIEATGNGITQSFGYDATDVRVTVDGVDQLWDRNGGLPTLISTGNGDNYVHTAGIARDGDDWLLSDAVGSVRATVDDTGATTGSQDFTVFGEQLTGTGSFGFAGEQQYLTGQLHLRARQYNPTLGRFTTVDPVQPGAPGTTGYNLYTYSANNPTTFTDPSGRAVLAEYAALVGDQADATEVFASGVGNCANASFSRATAGLEGFDIGEDPGQAVLRDCRDGAVDAAATGAVFSAGGRIVGEGLEAGARLAGDLRTGTRALPTGSAPTAQIGPSGNPGGFPSTAPARFTVDTNGTAIDISVPQPSIGSVSSATYNPANLGQTYPQGVVVNRPNLGITGFRGSANPNTPSHGLDRAIQRGFTSPQILDTVRTPAAVIQQPNGRFLYVSQSGAVVLDSSGQVVTVWSRADFNAASETILQDATRANP